MVTSVPTTRRASPLRAHRPSGSRKSSVACAAPVGSRRVPTTTPRSLRRRSCRPSLRKGAASASSPPPGGGRASHFEILSVIGANLHAHHDVVASAGERRANETAAILLRYELEHIVVPRERRQGRATNRLRAPLAASGLGRRSRSRTKGWDFDPLLAALAAPQSRELLTASESSAGSSTCWAAGFIASAGKIVRGRRLSCRTSRRASRNGYRPCGGRLWRGSHSGIRAVRS
jgi:hypothetical protein